MMLAGSLPEPGIYSHYNYESFSHNPVLRKHLLISLLVSSTLTYSFSPEKEKINAKLITLFKLP